MLSDIAKLLIKYQAIIDTANEQIHALNLIADNDNILWKGEPIGPKKEESESAVNTVIFDSWGDPIEDDCSSDSSSSWY